MHTTAGRDTANAEGDGTADSEVAVVGTDPDVADSDGDGREDGEEYDS